MTEDTEKWTADMSEVYRAIASVAVPDRAGQMAAILTLLPFRQDEAFRVVELGAGEGRLAWAMGHRFPQAALLALDIEETMREQAKQRLRPFGDRAAVEAFDLAAADWYGLLDGADVVVSSLCIHHLDGAEKRNLFREVRRRLSDRGAFLIADLILPQRNEARELFAATWDAITEQTSLAVTGSRAVYEQFHSVGWNNFRHDDPFDKPSPLSDQLLWLREAGFAVADCFWMQAGHAVYGGYASAHEGGGVSYTDALAAARLALD
jgi:tRNA (cmo5U34)-methyltransferase